MPPRKRNPENAGLPKRWKFQHGAYYYRVPPGLEHEWEGKKMFRLGGNLAEAYRLWADKIQKPATTRTIGDLLDRYMLEVVPTKAPASQRNNQLAVKQLRKVFEKHPIEPFPPRYVYRYVDQRTKKIAAHREIEVLSHAYTKAVEWGLIDRHPFKGQIHLKGEAPRVRYVEDAELAKVLAMESRRRKGSVRMIQAYIQLKVLTGMARSDLLRLQPARDFKPDGIHIQRHKTANTSGRRTIYEWTPELREAVEAAKAARPVDIAPWLFCNDTGGCYINEATGQATGWDSMWQRFMARVVKETGVEHFTEHDLRAKAGSDAASLEDARKMLSHVDASVTNRIYRRKPERVVPLKGAFRRGFNDTTPSE